MKKIIVALAVAAAGMASSGCATIAAGGALTATALLFNAVTSKTAVQPVAVPETPETGMVPDAPVISDGAMAKNLIIEGDEMYKRGDYAGALAKYDESLGFVESREGCVRIAYCLEKLGRKHDAKLLYDHGMRQESLARAY